MNRKRKSNSKVVVLGGGLAGLSALWHLQRQGCHHSYLFEKESRVGGLTRSETINGFTFDRTGHLLHFKNKDIQSLVNDLLEENIGFLTRSSWIFSQGVFTRYPFQSNLFGLPPEVILECILGFVRAPANRCLDEAGRPAGEQAIQSGAPPPLRYPNFAVWVEETLGKGIAKHFMLPYNRKLWTVEPHGLTCEWMGRFVPQTSLEKILSGALRDQTNASGYNARFGYPLRGGIEALPRAFSRSLKNIEVGFEVSSVDMVQRRIEFSNGESTDFDVLISSIPLPRLVGLLSSVPSEIQAAVHRLRFTSVFNVNLGVNRNLSDKHWVYFPEPEFCMYRAGFPHNFSPFQAPEGCGSIYVEVAYSPWKPIDKARVAGQVRSDLERVGILKDGDEILAELHLDIPCAYVLFDHDYRPNAERVRAFAHQQDIVTIGRYGAWEYSGMEDAIWQGRKAAEAVLGARGEVPVQGKFGRLPTV